MPRYRITFEITLDSISPQNLPDLQRLGIMKLNAFAANSLGDDPSAICAKFERETPRWEEVAPKTRLW